MQYKLSPSRIVLPMIFAIIFSICLTTNATAQGPKAMYDSVNAFALTGGKADVTNLELVRDRAKMSFTGTFYFPAPVDGKVTGAVFVGKGTFRAASPDSEFEKANLKRFLKTDEAVWSDFTTAVLKFSDDTFDVIGKGKSEGSATEQAQKLANDTQKRILKETGANLSSRVVLSMLNRESQGFFFGDFNGGRLDRFSYVFDPQNRIPTEYFDINAGEKGLIFHYDTLSENNEVWMATYAQSDYERGVAPYSDQSDLVDITNYDMNVDLRDPKKKLGLRTRISMVNKSPDLKALTFTIGTGLGHDRQSKQMHLVAARIGSTPVEAAQEESEGGFTVFFPTPLKASEKIDLELDLEGDFLRQPEFCGDCSYPRSNDSWYPRHGYLDRATFNFTYRHSKKLKVASGGIRLSEEPDPENKDGIITKYAMTKAVPMQTFALGPWKRHAEPIKWDNGDKPITLEFNSLPGDRAVIKEDFIQAELNNAVRYFQAMFGTYPYDSYGAVFHPYGFGQGFATMLTIPNTDSANEDTFSFIGHETAHQWWGNIVAWRSYRDQWLSEGFAEYSGALYAGARNKNDATRHLVDNMRRSVAASPETFTGMGKGKLSDVGPLIMGHRLETKETIGSYSALVYNKGGLVLRMIHFLMTDPSTGNGSAFNVMMKDFVERYRDKVASTDDFRRVAAEHFAKTPIAKKYGITDLDWFFNQWVYGTTLPSYKLEYQVQPQGDGTAIVTGNVFQDNVPDKFFMPMPILIKFGTDRYGTGTLAAYGPKTPFQIKLPAIPQSIELDPQRWVLSEKTSTK